MREMSGGTEAQYRSVLCLVAGPQHMGGLGGLAWPFSDLRMTTQMLGDREVQTEGL
jgi:hypothetical protein